MREAPKAVGPVTRAIRVMQQSVDIPERERIRRLREEIRAQFAELDRLLAKIENGRLTCLAS